MVDRQIKNFRVVVAQRNQIRDFIEKHHYSGSINGCISDYCFALIDGSDVIGAMFYGKMAMANQYKRFADNPNDVIELRRLCCIDDTPRNTESFFIGNTLRWLKRNTNIKTVVSYADSEYGHTGVIYKASNFKLEGIRKGAAVIMYNGKKYHDKAVRAKYNGKLKPFAVELLAALESGVAKYHTTSEKYCYVYSLR
jgi:hypothetical protein